MKPVWDLLRLLLLLRGNNGFGFDEIFELENGKTLAELTQDEKNEISARKIALEQIKKEINNL